MDEVIAEFFAKQHEGASNSIAAEANGLSYPSNTSKIETIEAPKTQLFPLSQTGGGIRYKLNRRKCGQKRQHRSLGDPIQTSITQAPKRLCGSEGGHATILTKKEPESETEVDADQLTL